MLQYAVRVGVAAALLCGCDEPSMPLHLESVQSIAVSRVGGGSEHPFRAGGPRLVAFIFVRTDCPIANRYAPELRRIYERFRSQGIDFLLVYTDPDESDETTRKHIEEYSLPFRAVRDTEHALVDLAGATITPEAALFERSGELLYRGRIDDRFVDFGKARRAASEHDFEDAIAAALAGRPIPAPRTEAVGCSIADTRPERHTGETQ